MQTPSQNGRSWLMILGISGMCVGGFLLAIASGAIGAGAWFGSVGAFAPGVFGILLFGLGLAFVRRALRRTPSLH